MCRLAYFPANTPVTRDDLLTHLNQLEKSMGGDGNGYVAIGPNGEMLLNKGVKLANKKIVNTIYPLIQQGWSVYYHTRKISIGWGCDAQCHPFEIDGDSFSGALCHNGTWMDGGTLAKYLQTGSDTATLAYLIGELGLDELEKRKLIPSSGVFLLYGAEPGETKQHKVLLQGGSLEYCPKSGVWSSEFFKDWPYYNDTYDVEKGRHMLEKQPPKAKYQSWTNYSGGNYQYRSYTPVNRGTLTKVDNEDQKRIATYWPRTDVRGDEDLDPIEAMGLCDEWENRQFYHQRMDD